MESSWGRAVSETGLGATGATLAARFLAFPLIVLTNGRDPLSTGIQLWFTRADTLAPFMVSHLGVGSLHFPYGLEELVEPFVVL